MSQVIDFFTGKTISCSAATVKSPAADVRQGRYAALPAHIVRDKFLNAEFTRLQDEGFSVLQFEGRTVLTHPECAAYLSYSEAVVFSRMLKYGAA